MRMLLAFSLCVVGLTAASSTDGYRLQKTLKVPGDGGWDYLIVDAAARRVYISHGTQVDVLDADSGEIKGTIADTKGVHGIALAPDLGRGFTSNGKANTVTVFDLKTLKSQGDVAVGKNPDCIVYEPATKQVFAFNGGSKSASVIDAANAKVVASIELGGRPEFAAVDGEGQVFVNLEDKNEVLKLDARKAAVAERWALKPGENPASMAIDPRQHRLFIGCRNKLLVVLDTEKGKVVTTLPVGERVDATAFDPETGMIFSSNGDGTVTVVHQESAERYTVVETIKTRPGSRTLALDGKTHRLFLPAAEFKAAPPATAETPRPRPTMVPGSFVVLVFGN